MIRCAILLALVLAPAAHGQFQPGGRFGGPGIGITATSAPHSAPGSIFPGAGPTMRPQAVLFPGFRSAFPRFPAYGFYGGFYPYSYWDFGYNGYYGNRGNVITIAPPEEPIFRVTRSPANPIGGLPPADSPSPTRARLTLSVPAAAEVWLNEEKLDGMGTERALESPELRAGASHTFRIRVRWLEGGEPVEEKRTLSVRVGESQSLTFIAAPPRPARAQD